MLEQNEYLITWGIYTVAVLGAMLVWWAMTRPIPWRWLKQPLRLLVTALLLVPAPVAADRVELAPAFIVYLFDAFLVEGGNGKHALLYLVFGAGIGLIIILVDAIAYALFGKSRRNKLT